MDYKLTNNLDESQYEFHLNGMTPKCVYLIEQDKVYLTHTEVPPELKGRGIGSCLVREVLEDIKEKDLFVIPLCPFVAAYIQKHPEWQSLVYEA